MDDARLLEHYLSLGREPWNLSPEAAYLDYLLRRWVRGAWSGGAPRVVNIGIGAGVWDDVLGYLTAPGGTLVSVDVDPDICALLRYRQLREQHPLPAHVVCGDLLDDALPAARFDIVTAVGSTLREIGVARREGAVASLARLAAPRGRLFVHSDCETADAAWLEDALSRCGLHVIEVRVVDDLPGWPQVLARASR